MTQQADPPRPRHIDVAESYNRGVDAYEVLWSPVILPPAIALVRRLELGSANLVVDVGAGTGALLAAIRSAAPTARTVALDASEQMLRVARLRGTSAILGDALALPLSAACPDAVVLAYVLPHLADPVLALAEAARVAPARPDRHRDLGLGTSTAGRRPMAPDSHRGGRAGRSSPQR